MDGSSLEEHLGELDSLIVRSESEDGPCVREVPEVAPRALATADNKEPPHLSESWVQTDEPKKDGDHPKDVGDLLKALASLAKTPP